MPSGPPGRRLGPRERPVVVHAQRLGGGPPHRAVARFADGDAHQPAAQRALGTVRAQLSIGEQERLLSSILGLGRVCQDPPAGGQDRRRLAIDEDAKGVVVAAEYRVGQRAILFEAARPVRRDPSCGRVGVGVDGHARPSVRACLDSDRPTILRWLDRMVRWSGAGPTDHAPVERIEAPDARFVTGRRRSIGPGRRRRWSCSGRWSTAGPGWKSNLGTPGWPTIWQEGRAAAGS